MRMLIQLSSVSFPFSLLNIVITSDWFVMKCYKLSDTFLNKIKYDVIHKLLVCVLTVLQITLYSVRTEFYM